mmetsp:Transcript_18774/g.46952  ORF Transcript_18774/g.46952 Transcript_18774/m.46952 type:complete len:937 (-) Transcript_18774:171-2981(-)|eukprot:CAMPEP_0179002346 /NCGR_PEP_ID=MMETSP0795-20121207/11952_1 /TAXON_ID=88552 /ORGANISM="Amoebophrya sp., Strain Ameob2" /LENGTH=936 /DNA_ID=CAMNT_0020695995 /DNA_START=280 /DNA_END=3090 /DNA_ORIENTATION=+
MASRDAPVPGTQGCFPSKNEIAARSFSSVGPRLASLVCGEDEAQDLLFARPVVSAAKKAADPAVPAEENTESAEPVTDGKPEFSPLQVIPNAVLVEVVLPFLPAQDLARLECVCRYFRAVGESVAQRQVRRHVRVRENCSGGLFVVDFAQEPSSSPGIGDNIPEYEKSERESWKQLLHLHEHGFFRRGVLRNFDWKLLMMQTTGNWGGGGKRGPLEGGSEALWKLGYFQRYDHPTLDADLECIPETAKYVFAGAWQDVEAESRALQTARERHVQALLRGIRTRRFDPRGQNVGRRMLVAGGGANNSAEVGEVGPTRREEAEHDQGGVPESSCVAEMIQRFYVEDEMHSQQAGGGKQHEDDDVPKQPFFARTESTAARRRRFEVEDDLANFRNGLFRFIQAQELAREGAGAGVPEDGNDDAGQVEPALPPGGGIEGDVGDQEHVVEGGDAERVGEDDGGGAGEGDGDGEVAVAEGVIEPLFDVEGNEVDRDGRRLHPEQRGFELLGRAQLFQVLDEVMLAGEEQQRGDEEDVGDYNEQGVNFMEGAVRVDASDPSAEMGARRLDSEQVFFGEVSNNAGTEVGAAVGEGEAPGDGKRPTNRGLGGVGLLEEDTKSDTVDPNPPPGDEEKAAAAPPIWPPPLLYAEYSKQPAMAPAVPSAAAKFLQRGVGLFTTLVRSATGRLGTFAWFAKLKAAIRWRLAASLSPQDAEEGVDLHEGRDAFALTTAEQDATTTPCAGGGGRLRSSEHPVLPFLLASWAPAGVALKTTIEKDEFFGGPVDGSENAWPPLMAQASTAETDGAAAARDGFAGSISPSESDEEDYQEEDEDTRLAIEGAGASPRGGRSRASSREKQDPKHRPAKSVFWYRWRERSFGFSENPDLFLRYADSRVAFFGTEEDGDTRLSWNLDRGESTGGWRAGTETELGSRPRNWYKVLLYRE